jgi:hypothetical protein
MRHDWSRLANTTTDRHTLKHGLDLVWFGKDSESAAKYIHKISKEITLSHNKTEGSTNDPFTLLDQQSPSNTARYIEYVEATHGRQATRWSNGLHELLIPHIEKKTDQQLNDDNKEPGIVVMIINKNEWNYLDDEARLDLIDWCQNLPLARAP